MKWIILVILVTTLRVPIHILPNISSPCFSFVLLHALCAAKTEVRKHMCSTCGVRYWKVGGVDQDEISLRSSLGSRETTLLSVKSIQPSQANATK